MRSCVLPYVCMFISEMRTELQNEPNNKNEILLGQMWRQIIIGDSTSYTKVDFIQLRASYTKVDLSQFSAIESVILIEVVYTIIINANTD